jgi:hypothetical protein
MIFRLALRSLLAHPVRTLVLAGGFGLGVGVMAMLLGVGEVILDQARSPALVGGGDVFLSSTNGRIAAPKWVLSSVLRSERLHPLVAAASPARRARLYLVRNGQPTPVVARGGIPSLERALGDAETASVVTWVDDKEDREWTSPDPAVALRSLDRFHAIPDVPDRAQSWAEWLYFNGRAGDNRFYLTFAAGPRRADGRRAAGVRLQLDRAGNRSSYVSSTNVDEAALLRDAPDLAIGSSRVKLNGLQYELTLDLAREESGGRRVQAPDRIAGTLIIEAHPGRALPPLTIRGAGDWLSGYVVPVMSGTLSGALNLDGEAVSFDGGTGYHDHNWGFWKDVSWRWGQVQHGDLSIVYGRVYPPADAADPKRAPSFLMLLGRDGPLGYATNLSIDETNDPASGLPRSIVVAGRSDSLDLTLELGVEESIITRAGAAFFGGELDFLQLRARYRVRGTAGNRSIDFAAAGSAETFRSR